MIHSLYNHRIKQELDLPKSNRNRSMIIMLLSILLPLLAGCKYPAPSFTEKELLPQTKDSLNFLAERHYTYNANFELCTDSILMERIPIKDSYVLLQKGDRVVVAEFAIYPTDSIDSVWVKLAHNQEMQGWIREKELIDSFMPTDSISQAIYLFSHTHASYFVVIFALFIVMFLFRGFYRKQLKLIYFNDINSIYPITLCLLIAFGASIYESMQLFVPETWQHFYFNPTLSPFKVPFILSIFLLSLWLSVIVFIALIEDSFRQLRPAAAIFYLLGVMSACIFCYFFFIFTTSIYIGFIILPVFALLLLKRVPQRVEYKYQCGKCGAYLKAKGVCPNCGALNQ